MQIYLDLKTPSIISKIAELAPAMIAGGANLRLIVTVNDQKMIEVMGDYFRWAGMMPEGEGEDFPPVTVTPVPAPVVSAPAAPVSAPAVEQASPAVTSGPALDAYGVPYNADIHAPTSGRTGGRNADGRWKMKKGADRAAYDGWRQKHEALRAVASGVAAAQRTPAPEVDEAWKAAAPANPFAAVLEDPGEAAVSAKATDLAMRGIMTPAHVNELMAELSCDAMAFLKDPGVRPKVWQFLNKLEADAVTQG